MKRVLTIISLVINSILLVFSSFGVFHILSPILEPGGTGAIGIIGRDEGPTAVFISSEFVSFGPVSITILFCVLFIFELAFILNLYPSKKKK